MSVELASWSLSRRILFRFVVIFFTLQILPFPLNAILPLQWLPGVGRLGELYSVFWQRVVPPIGKHLLGVSGEIATWENGSGDRLFDYLRYATLFVTALVASAAWSMVEHRRAEYTKLWAWFLVALRYYLAYSLLSYGFAKIFNSQFPFPGPSRLYASYRDSSPMGLLWNFMGCSTPYTMFAGFCEALGALLLFWQSTATLGALVCAGVMSNVVMLNFSYDVPVKLYSSLLLSMALVLVAADGRRVLDVLVSNRAVPAREFALRATRPRVARALFGLKALVVTGLVGSSAYHGYSAWREYGAAAERPPLYGLWDVQSFVKNGHELVPGPLEPDLWKTLSIDWKDWASVRLGDERRVGIAFQVDPASSRIEWGAVGQTGPLQSFRYAQTPPDTLSLEGVVNGEPVVVQFKRRDSNSSLLMSRGFHWINEYPLNR